MIILKSPELRQVPACRVDKKLYWQHVVGHLDDVMGAPVEFRIRLDGARALVPGELAEIQLRTEESEFPSERPDALGNECSVRRRARWVEQGIIPGLVAKRSVDDVPVGEPSSKRDQRSAAATRSSTCHSRRRRGETR